jgi:hypothetical protein
LIEDFMKSSVQIDPLVILQKQNDCVELHWFVRHGKATPTLNECGLVGAGAGRGKLPFSDANLAQPAGAS